MSRLIPVIYRNMKYPSDIKASIHEVSGNFAQEELSINDFSYSLHTDSASKPQTFTSKIFSDLVHILSVKEDGIPQLWYNKDWAKDFFIFIDRLIANNNPPEVLEIHPPFNNYPIFKECKLSSGKFDYCGAFKIFLDIFDNFYKQFKPKYPSTTILIENRGSNWSGRFLLSRPYDVLEFARILSDSNTNLKIVLDYPQIFSAVYISTNSKKKKELRQKGIIIDDDILKRIISFNQELKKYKDVIRGLHMWGKCKDENGKWVSHSGNLNTFFGNGKELEKLDDKEKKLKKAFLESVFDTFNDNIPRYFVPEVNSGEKDIHSIVVDMENVGFKFISQEYSNSNLRMIEENFDKDWRM